MVKQIKILGVLPLAGSGLRLGADFHKSLMPFPVPDSMNFKPIVQFSIERLKQVAVEIVAVISSDSQHTFPAEKFDVIPLNKPEQGEASSSICFAAQYAQQNGYSHIAVSLPDTYWEPLDGLVLLKNYLLQSRENNWDGALGLFLGDVTMLDQVALGFDNLVTEITTRGNQNETAKDGWGWGCFILSTDGALLFSDDSSWAENILKSKVAGVKLSASYFDIGSPARYISALKSVLL